MGLKHKPGGTALDTARIHSKIFYAQNRIDSAQDDINVKRISHHSPNNAHTIALVEVRVHGCLK